MITPQCQAYLLCQQREDDHDSAQVLRNSHKVHAHTITTAHIQMHTKTCIFARTQETIQRDNV